MKFKLSVGVAALAVGALLMSGCAGGSTPSGPTDGPEDSDLGPLVIDSFQALSGPVAPVGEAMSIGNRAAVNVINEQGGVFGKPIELVIEDSAGSADQLAAKLQELLASKVPHAVLPGSASEIPAGIPILANAGVFTSHHFTADTFNDPAQFPLVFGNAHTIPDYVASFTAKLVADGHKTVGVVNSDDASGQAFQAVAKPALEDAGIEATFSAVAPTAVDATPQIQQVLANDPDALVFAGYFPGAIAMLNARAKLGVDVPTIAAQTFGANDFSSVAPAELEGIEFQYLAANVKGTEATSTEGFDIFYDAVLEEAGGSLPFPINTYMVSYNDVILVAYAASLANSLDPEKMVEALENAKPEDMPLYVMPVGFSAENHYPLVTEEDFVFIPYSPTENGLVIAP
ncbi:ABC transporter substrate-binding protein [Microbacterium sp.]|uniref:ABC transporter substrate-binding protein n=1 Tax=Microbacterium sp. TaxID=51671 RepID=UPI0037CC3595